MKLNQSFQEYVVIGHWQSPDPCRPPDLWPKWRRHIVPRISPPFHEILPMLLTNNKQLDLRKQNFSETIIPIDKSCILLFNLSINPVVWWYYFLMLVLIIVQHYYFWNRVYMVPQQFHHDTLVFSSQMQTLVKFGMTRSWQFNHMVDQLSIAANHFFLPLLIVLILRSTF